MSELITNMDPPATEALVNSTSFSERMLAERLSLVYEQMLRHQLISPVIGSILVYSLWPLGKHRLLLGWLIVLVAISVWRYVLARRFLAVEAELRDVRAGERSFLLSLATASAAWGIGGWLIMPASSNAYQALVYCFLVGMAGGTLATYAAHRASAAITASLMLGPSMLYMLTFMDTFHTAFLAGTVALVVAGSRGIALMNGAMQRSLELADELDRLSRSDVLSGLANRRAFTEFGTKTLATAARHQRPCAIMMLDVDHFKRINDQHGHAAGDQLIGALGRLLSDTVRAGDIPARIGGDEFAVLLPEATVEQAQHLAERILNLARQISFAPVDQSIQLTVSIGVAALRAQSPLSLNESLSFADEALYRAKQAGRNTVYLVEK